MRFDLYADLAALKACPADCSLPQGLAAGFVDSCTSWSTRGNNEKNDARRCYMQRASRAIELKEFKQLELDANIDNLLDPTWLAFKIAFELETPWYSKDDRSFHVLDNPVRKDRVFGVPFMSAASWKGLLRWACRMHAGLRDHLEKHVVSSTDGMSLRGFCTLEGAMSRFQGTQDCLSAGKPSSYVIHTPCAAAVDEREVPLVADGGAARSQQRDHSSSGDQAGPRVKRVSTKVVKTNTADRAVT